MDGSLGKAYLKNYIASTEGLFDAYIQEKLHEADTIDPLAGELLRRYHKTAKLGKKIRGALVVLGYEAFGGKDLDEILDASMFIELLHAGLLIHDDIMDWDDVRRGLPTLHKQFEEYGRSVGILGDAVRYGISMAIGAGDLGFYLSWDKLMSSGFSPNRLKRISEIYSKHVIRVVYGQSLDLTITNLIRPEKEILKVHKYKTAEYTGVLPILSGAMLSDEEQPEKIQAITNFGLSFGWAFQIQDDALGVFGEEEDIGKPVGSDIREAKNTLFTNYVFEKGCTEHKEFLQSVFGNKDITYSDVEKIRKILKESGAYEYAIDLGWDYVKKGKELIPLITQDKKYQNILESLLVYMMERAA